MTKAQKDDFHSAIIKQNETMIELLIELNISINSILDVLQTGNQTIYTGINTSQEDDESLTQEDDSDIDLPELKQAVRVALEKVGSPVVVDLFKKFGVDRVSDVAPEQYASMLKALEAL